MRAHLTSALFLAILLPWHTACGGDLPAAGKTKVSTQKVVVTKADETAYARVLSTFLNEESMVDYARLKEQRRDLDAYVIYLGSISKADFDTWDADSRLALWLNAYNALTLRVIIDNYPIKPNFARSLLYPENSIRQIPGVWDDFKFTVAGQKLSLEEIEHEVIRKQFLEPRIHMALVCAAVSCPPLRREPYQGSKLNEQLDDQSRQFLKSERNFLLEREKKAFSVSSIFRWFAEDFKKKLGGTEEEAIRAFVASYLSDSEKAFVDNKSNKLDYLDYDWTLNVQP